MRFLTSALFLDWSSVTPVASPRILGGRLQLHPMAVFLGLLVGGKLFEPFYSATPHAAGTVAATSIETRMARAEEQVLHQGDAATGDEPLAPAPAEDDPTNRRMDERSR
jgi:hypothetical protein